MPNRLAAEQSPYLLQHANNPVEWYPWGDAAFEAARREHKPIFLSIGYSTCHWCHVMEHESFEDAEVANALNRDYVAIKVDREERPDIDRVYMAFVQATTGSGGWPMSVWLTPDLKPFYGGTYFPPTSRWGRPGLIEILRDIGRVWKDSRDEVVRSAEGLTEHLRGIGERPVPGGPLPGPEALEAGVIEFDRAFDRRRGGFGGAPKFPRPSELLFLLREHVRTGNAAAREMVVQTLRAMALGGLRDHVGGGFHRYSVDADWRVPHFEKMLYDQAQLVLAYLEAAQVTGDRFHAEVAEDTLQYVDRELTDQAGGFYSAEDADSLPPEAVGQAGARTAEGAFYLWRDAEIAELLGADADAFRFRFGVEPDGNAPHDPAGEFAQKNLLYIARAVEDAARLAGRRVEEIDEALARARGVLLKARAARPRPHLDDKVLTAWNGLMIAAFARAARTLAAQGTHGPAGTDAQEDRADVYARSARRAALFLRTTMWDESRGLLLRRYRRGHAAIEGYAEDYAYLVAGLIELFQADADPTWLDWALALQARQDALFWDPIEGGWFSTTGRDASVLLRLKEDYDGAEPTASSVSVANLMALAHLTGESAFVDKAERTLRLFGSRLGQHARALPMMMAALSAHQAGGQQVVVVGRRNAEETRALVRAMAASYLPFAVTLVVEPGAHQDQLARRLPWIASLRLCGGRATAYVCRAFACRQPMTDPDEFRQELTRK